MSDLLFVIAAFVFFLACGGLIVLCQRLLED